MMKKKKEFESPGIIQQVTVQLEKSILVGSAIEMQVIKSSGQDVETLDFDTSGSYNSYWEE